MTDKIELFDLVVATHKGHAQIGQVEGINIKARLGTHKLKEKKFAYKVRFGGASIGFYLNGRKLKKLNEWQANEIKKVLTF